MRSAQASFVEREEPTDVHHGVLLGAHRAPVGKGEHLSRDLPDGSVSLSRLTMLDEPGILREPAGVDEQRHAKTGAERADAADVLQADRLSSSRVVRDGHHHERNTLPAFLREHTLQACQIDVPLERMDSRRVPTLRDDEVQRPRPLELHVRPGGVEVRVVRNGHAGTADRREQDPLRRAPLMAGQDMPEARQRPDPLFERNQERAPA